MGTFTDRIAGLFSGSSYTPPPPPQIADVARSPIPPSRVAACEAVHKDALAKASTASAALDDAKSQLDAAEGERARAEREAEAKGDDASISALHRAQTKLGFASKRHAAATDEANAAQSAVTSAQTAIDVARAEVESAERLADLQERASLEAYRTKVAPLAREAVAALDTARRCLDAIDANFDDANKASAELRVLGHDVPDLDVIHRIGEVFRLFAARDPSGLIVLQHRGDNLHMLSHLLQAGRSLASVVLASVDSSFSPGGRGAVPSERVPELAASLDAVLTARTSRQGIQAIRDAAFRAGNVDEINRRRNEREAPPPGCAMPDPVTPSASPHHVVRVIRGSTGEEVHVFGARKPAASVAEVEPTMSKVTTLGEAFPPAANEPPAKPTARRSSSITSPEPAPRPTPDSDDDDAA